MGIVGSVIRPIFTIISYGYAMWALPLAATAFLVNLRLWFELWVMIKLHPKITLVQPVKVTNTNGCSRTYRIILTIPILQKLIYSRRLFLMCFTW